LFIDTLRWLAFDFSFSFLHALPWANAKEKKTTDQSGCFNSYEMAGLLQDSIGKQLTIPSFQTQTTSSFPPFQIPIFFLWSFVQSKQGLTPKHTGLLYLSHLLSF
jgi:hypothetical protein